MGNQTNRLIETVRLSTRNICFGWEIRKIIFKCAVLPWDLLRQSDWFLARMSHEYTCFCKVIPFTVDFNKPFKAYCVHNASSHILRRKMVFWFVPGLILFHSLEFTLEFWHSYTSIRNKCIRCHPSPHLHRVLASRSRNCGFESHRCLILCCVLEQDKVILA